jgi:hypothetical protein
VTQRRAKGRRATAPAIFSGRVKLKDPGTFTADSEPGANPSPKEAVSLLESQSSELVRGLVGEEAVNVFNKMGPALNSSEILVFVQYMKATQYMDRDIRRDPRLVVDNLLLQAVLLSGKTGKILGRDQVFTRIRQPFNPSYPRIPSRGISRSHVLTFTRSYIPGTGGDKEFKHDSGLNIKD